MDTKKFSIEDVLKGGWHKTKEHFLFLFLTGLVYFVISMVLGSVNEGDFPVNTLSFLISVIFGVLFQVGMIKILMRITGNEKPDAHQFLAITPGEFFRYIGCSILYGLAILGGLILLIIPGIIIGIRLQFGYYFLIDKKMGPVEALKASWGATRGQTWDLFLFTLVTIAINIIGVLLLGLGLIITIPVTLIAVAYIYRAVSNAQMPQVIPEPAAIVPPPPHQDTPAPPVQ